MQNYCNLKGIPCSAQCEGIIRIFLVQDSFSIRRVDFLAFALDRLRINFPICSVVIELIQRGSDWVKGVRAIDSCLTTIIHARKEC
jgi:hypothetical protein